MVTSILKVFSIDVYDLLDPGATLSFVIPLVSKKFYIQLDILHESFIVSIRVVESIVEKGCIEIILLFCPIEFIMLN